MSTLVRSLESRVLSGWGKALLFCFVFGFVVRLIPEVLLSPVPVGYDSIMYAWRIKSGVVWYHWSQFFSAWLLYAVLVPLYNATQANLFTLVKVVAASLFGFNACGMYYFATKGLEWPARKGIVAGVFFSLQSAALFVSWNYYRNMLGLGILLFTLPWIKGKLADRKQFLAFALLSILVVLGHEFASAILLAVVLGLLVTAFLRGRVFDVKRILIAVIPAFALFAVSLSLSAFPFMYQMEKNCINLVEPRVNYQGALYFFSNYLGVYEPGQWYAAYLGLVSQVSLVFVALYVLMLPLVLVGFFRDVALDAWTALAVIGTFGAVVMPFFAPSYWSRWMFMLVFPFTFYAVNGISRIWRTCDQNFGLSVSLKKRMNLRKAALTLTLIISILSGLIYAVRAMPTQVSAVPLVDSADTVKALGWVDSEMSDDAVLLAHFAFRMWSRLYLDERHARIYFRDDIGGALSLATRHGFGDVYFVWWREPVAWYGLEVPEGFVRLQDFGRISVYEFVG